LQSRDSSFFDFSFNLLPEDILGTEEIPEHICSVSSAEEEDATHEQRANHQLRCHIRHLEHDLRDITVRCCAEHECRMSLEVVRSLSPIESHVQVQIPCLTRICSSFSDMSDRYNNLKTAWDSLMEAAEHASPQGFHVAVTVVLEQLKRDELKRKNAEPKK
jgi:hypothetical protein